MIARLGQARRMQRTAFDDIDDLKRAGDVLGLVQMAFSHDPERADARWWAVRALSKLRDPSAVEPLVKLLADEDEHVRFAAARALGRIGDVRSVPALVDAFEDTSPIMRGWAAQAVGRIGDRQAVGPLIALLDDPDPLVSAAAVDALREIGDPTALAPLHAVRARFDRRNRRRVDRAVRAISRGHRETFLSRLRR